MNKNKKHGKLKKGGNNYCPKCGNIIFLGQGHVCGPIKVNTRFKLWQGVQ